MSGARPIRRSLVVWAVATCMTWISTATAQDPSGVPPIQSADLVLPWEVDGCDRASHEGCLTAAEQAAAAGEHDLAFLRANWVLVADLLAADYEAANELGNAQVPLVSTALVDTLRESCDAGGMLSCYAAANLLEMLGRLEEAKPRYETACEARGAMGCLSLGFWHRLGLGGAEDPQAARRYWENACDLGHVWGCDNLADLLADGVGGPEDPGRARALFEGTCQRGDLRACHRLGWMTYNGKGCDPDASAARGIFDDLCRPGVPWGCASLASLLFRGEGGEPDRQRARQLFEEACETGDADVCLTAGEVLCGEDPEDRALANGFFLRGCMLGGVEPCLSAIELVDEWQPEQVDTLVTLLELACDGSDPGSCNRLGVLLHQGRVVPEDRNAAADLFDRACEAGETWGCHNLAMSLAGQDDAGAGDVRARELFEEACSGGRTESCTELAVWLAGGRGGDTDQEKAARLLADACISGNGRACDTLFFATDPGETSLESLPPFVTAALETLCDAGKAKACLRLGNLTLFDSLESLQSIMAARAYFDEARAHADDVCTGEDPETCYEVASLELDARLGEFDPERARPLLDIACGPKEPRACLDEGDLWRLGMGGEADSIRARDTYQIACDSGYSLGCLKARWVTLDPDDDLNPFGDCPAATPSAPGLTDRAEGSPDFRTVVQQGHTNVVYALEMTPDSRILVSGGVDGTAKAWHVPSGRLLHTFAAHDGGVNDLVLGARGDELFTAGEDGWVRRWDLATGSMLREFRGSSQGVTALTLSPDGTVLITGDVTGLIRTWETETGELRLEIAGHRSMVSSLQVYENGTRLASGSWDATARVWEMGTGAPLMSLEGHRGIVTSIAVFPDGRRLATASMDPFGSDEGAPTGTTEEPDHTVRLWDLREGTQLHVLGGIDEGVASVDVSPDGRQVAAGSGTGTIILWDAETGARIREWVHSGQVINGVRFAPHGRWLITSEGFARIPTEITIWDLDRAVALRSFGSRALPVYDVAVSGDGRHLATSSFDGTPVLWDLALHRRIPEVGWPRDAGTIHDLPVGERAELLSLLSTSKAWTDDSGIDTLAFTPGGSTLLTSRRYQKRIVEFSASSGEQVHMLELDLVADAIAPVPGTDLLVTSDVKAGTVLWNLRSGERVREVLADSSSNMQPDLPGRALLFDSTFGVGLADLRGERSVREYNLGFGGDRPSNLSNPFLGGRDPTLAPVFSLGGDHVIAAGYSGVWIWDRDSGELVWTFGGPGWNVNEAALSPCGCKLLVSGTDTPPTLYDLRSGRALARLALPADVARAVAFSTDGRDAYVGLDDGSTRVWDVERGELLATMLFDGPMDWAVVTPDGYYMASKGQLSNVHFVRGLQPFTFDQFDLRLNRPDLVLSRLGRASPAVVDAYHAAYRARLRRVGLTEERLGEEIALPQVEILSDDIPLLATGSFLTLRVRAQDERLPLDRLDVTINAVPVFGRSGIPLDGEAEAERSFEVELGSGHNTIAVTALNQAGIRSLSEIVEVDLESGPDPGRLVLLAVGVSDYADDTFDLTYAAKDARDVGDLLRGEGSRYGSVEVQLVLDDSATRENILAVRRDLEATSIEDTVVVYLAGHGLLGSDFSYYFATHDIDFDHPEDRGLAYGEIEALLDGIPARRRLLLMDTCHAGELDPEQAAKIADAAIDAGSSEVRARAVRGARVHRTGEVMALTDSFGLMQELFADLQTATGTHVIAAAGGIEVSLESDRWRNGVFTHAVLRGLEGEADLDGDGAIRVSELRDHVRRVVAELTSGAQQPVARHENLAFDFEIF